MESLTFFMDRSSRDPRNTNRIPHPHAPSPRSFFLHEHHHLHQHPRTPQHQHNHSSPPRLQSLPHAPHRMPIEDARLLLPRPASGPPVPTDHWDHAAILEYRQRVNGSLPTPQHLGLASNFNRITRNQALDWESPSQQLQRHHVSVSGLHRLEGSSLRSENGYGSLEDAARSRQVVLREQNRQNLGRDGREDMRKNDHYSPLSLSELANSRRSAALSAKAFLDEGRREGSFVPGTVYNATTTSHLKPLLEHRLALEREEAFQESRLRRNSPRTIERGSPFSKTLASRKRSREEELEFERESYFRQKRFQESNLPASLLDNRSLHVKRTLDQFGSEQTLRYVDGEAVKVTPSNASSSAFSRRDLYVPSHSPLPNSREFKYSMQQNVHTRTLPMERGDRRSSSPHRDSQHSLPPKAEDIGLVAQKSVQTKKSARRIRKNSGSNYGGVNDKPKQQFPTSARRTDIDSKVESKSKTQPRCSHHDQAEDLHALKRLKKPAEHIEKPMRSRSSDKDQQAVSVKRHRMASDQKESKPSSRASGKCSGAEEPALCRSLKSRVTLVNADTGEDSLLLRKLPKPTGVEVLSRKEGPSREFVASNLCSSQVVHNVMPSRSMGNAILLTDDLPQLDLELEHLNVTRSGSGRKPNLSAHPGPQQMLKTQVALPGQNGAPINEKWKPPSNSRKFQPSSEPRIEVVCASEGEISTPGAVGKFAAIHTTESMLHGKQSFSVSEHSLPSAYQTPHPTWSADSKRSTQDVHMQSSSSRFVEAASVSSRGGSPGSLQHANTGQQRQSLSIEGLQSMQIHFSPNDLSNSLNLPLEEQPSAACKEQIIYKPGIVPSLERLAVGMEEHFQFTPLPVSLKNTGHGLLTSKYPSMYAIEGVENSLGLAGISIGKTCSEETVVEVLDTSPGDKMQGSPNKHSDFLPDLSNTRNLQIADNNLSQICEPDVRGKVVLAEADIPCRSITPLTVTSLRGSTVTPVSAASSEIEELVVPESHKHLGIKENNSPTNAQPDQTAEREVRLFGKTLKATVSELSQQQEDALKTDGESPLQPEQARKSCTEASQPTQLEQLQNSIASSSTKSALHLRSPLVNLPSQQAKGAGILVARGTGEKGLASQSQVKHPVHQFRQRAQVNANPHIRKLSPAATQRQHCLAMMPTSARSGAHTWRRCANTNSSTGLTATSKVTMKTSFDAATQGLQLVGKRGVAQVAAYVRKGNSLVRAPVSSSLSTVSKTGIVVKDTAGKLLHAHESSQRAFSQVRNFKKNSAPLKRVSSGPLLHAIESTGRLTPIEKSESLHCAANNITFQTIASQMSLQAVIPVIPNTDSNITHSVKATGLVEDENHNENLKSLAAIDNTVSIVNMDEPHSSEIASSVPSVGNLTFSVNRMNNTSVETSESSQALYVKSKANQLVAALPPNSQGLSRTVSGSGLSFSAGAIQDHYYKRKMNQLIRNSTHVGSPTNRLLQCSSGGFQLQDATKVRMDAILQTKLGRVLSQKHTALCSSWVWTLNGAKCGVVNGTASQRKGYVPLLFPWKRPGFRSTVRSGRFKALPKAKKGSLLFLVSKKLQSLRKIQPVYTRSARGFSLHRSGVLSLGGANLKWTKSIENRSKKASEEATKAVAAVEKKRREEKEAEVEAATAVARAKADRRAARKAARGTKLHPRERIVLVGLVRYKMDPSKRTLQRLPDQVSTDANDTSAGSEAVEAAKISTPRRLSIGGAEYVRVGNGNQLVRDPKAATRALASEKVRWSLHTVRSRRAKKQQYCQFFTRFGKCNKSKGKCLYIHDPEKVAVCTKFLKGSCLGTNCLLTHKVIPERMPDCSYFLQGLCTNENCPYRHVNVNPKAPICEGFLKGYCADGDQCNKKHTHVCMSYAATGECPDRPSCKLHHPKKKDKDAVHVVTHKTGAKRKRRYFVAAAFGSGETVTNIPCSDQREDEDLEPASIANESLEFISLPNIEINFDEEEDIRENLSTVGQLDFLRENISKDETDAWIKPIRLLQKKLDVVSMKMLTGCV